jgi:two-component system, chemotaxis family, protein-glutamate methylesterase/glutaminase
MINVLLVEDSPTAAELVRYILNSAPDIRVIAVARDGEQAIQSVTALAPDVVAMDIQLPGMNGFEATRIIMETRPTPIIIVSGIATVRERQTSMSAFEAGALAVVERPVGFGHPEFAAQARELIMTVRTMSEVRLVRRWKRNREGGATVVPNAPPISVRNSRDVQVVAIGASTGGPMALQSILTSLPPDEMVPLLVVQHMARGFTVGFVEWLESTTRYAVRVASPGAQLVRGRAYVAPDGFHLGVGDQASVMLSSDDPEHGSRPSVSFLFRSVASVFRENAMGILLTGMGADGAAELKLMRDAGAITIAQDEQSSVVHGMPGEAIRLGGATQVLPLTDIAESMRCYASDSATVRSR